MNDIFDKISGDGWAGIENAEEIAAEANRQNAQAQFNAAIVIARPFMSSEGHQCLKALRDMTIEQPAWVPGQDAAHGFAREGQNSIVRYVETCIRIAMQGPPVPVSDAGPPPAPAPQRKGRK